jgi:mono/diheme cytochrome c family protein
MIRGKQSRDLGQSLLVHVIKRLLASAALTIFAGLPMSQAAASEVDAAGYYELRCASCHGAEGEGTRDRSPSLGPPLRGNPFVINAPVEMLVSLIRHGRGGQQRVYDDAYPNMPAFDAGLVPDAAGLVNYLKTVLQQNDKTNDTSDRAPEPPDEDAVTPGDVAVRFDDGIVAPRCSDSANRGELQATISIPVFR